MSYDCRFCKQFISQPDRIGWVRYPTDPLQNSYVKCKINGPWNTCTKFERVNLLTYILRLRPIHALMHKLQRGNLK